MQPQNTPSPAPRPDAGFTLIETLVAIVILVFGLMAVTNLMVIGATSNNVANQSSAATTQASQTLEDLKRTSYTALTVGGSLTADLPGFSRNDVVPGVGVINTRWIVVDPGDPQVRFITVQSEGTALLMRARSRATFSTFRSCTAVNQGCP
jgi:prepilin-type N-terminal cleavage/methylation domain-containing protein